MQTITSRIEAAATEKGFTAKHSTINGEEGIEFSRLGTRYLFTDKREMVIFEASQSGKWSETDSFIFDTDDDAVARAGRTGGPCRRQSRR